MRRLVRLARALVDIGAEPAWSETTPVVVQPPAAPPIGQQAAPVEPTSDRTHERAMPDDRGPPTSVPAFTIR